MRAHARARRASGCRCRAASTARRTSTSRRTSPPQRPERFSDLEELGRQARAELYRLCAGHPPPLVPPELRVPVPERIGPDEVLRPLDEEALGRRIASLPGDLESAGVCLLWGFRDSSHERRVAELVEQRGLHVSTAHETAGVFREYERCATTVVHAALSSLLRRYLELLRERVEDAGLPY